MMARKKNKLSVLVLAAMMTFSQAAPRSAWAEPGGPQPGPTPTRIPPGHIPTPSGTPTAQPSPAPAVDTGPARRDGYRDGMSDGQREGILRGPIEGDRVGRQDGYRRGFDRCEREEREKAFDFGYREGFSQGEREGFSNGSTQGERDGQARGLSDGERDGTARADRDANAAATPLGRAQGIEEADRSDATARGQADGLIAGDRDALQKARTDDYARGRRDYRDERYAEAVSSTDEFSQARPQRLNSLSSLIQSSVGKLFGAIKGDAGSTAAGDRDGESPVKLTIFGQPDRRFYSPRCSYPTSMEETACRAGYDDGYLAGFNSTYDRSYRETYDRGFHLGENDGCRRARDGDYRGDYRRGFDSGRTDGYDRAYKTAYDRAYREMYDRRFGEASGQAYSQNYDRFYETHFETARIAAYRARVDALYDAAFDRAHDAKFAEMYPQYAAQEYKRGRADEAEDFRLRPVRLLGAEVVETIPNGVYEPGELIRVRMQLRNFAAQAVSGKDIRVSLSGPGTDVVIAVPEVLLARDLRAKSITTITEVLEFRLTESNVGQSTTLALSVAHQGRKAGGQGFNLTARFMLDVSFAEAPVLHEGMDGELKIRVKNISQGETAGALSLRMSSGSEAIEITHGQASIGALRPGEEKIVTFGAIARQGGHPELRLAVEVTDASARRIGLLDKVQEIPVLNDYTVELGGGVAALKSAGVVRAGYVLKNVSSRVLMKSLQLHVRVRAADAKDSESFVVLGPNPQYLTPLKAGQVTKFVVPILVKNANSGGVVELELKEAGRTVVIHRAEF